MVRRGAVFAGFVIERELGRGGMGSVYAAKDRRLPRLTALKLMHRELFADTEIRARFEREADVIAQLDHPNIITVYDRGVEDERCWIAMQFVDGTDAAAVPAAEFGTDRIAQIVTQTAGALDYAHRQGVLHRDVKPANILLSRTAGVGAGFDERVVLTDFGIAKLLDDTGGLTRTGQFTATIAYASPEQLSSEPLDGRGDQYSLACTVFRLLTGTGPYDAPNPATVMLGHLNAPPPSASSRRTSLPAAVDAVLAKALAKNPAHRFPTCTAFATALTEALRRPPHTTDPGHQAPTIHPATHRRWDPTEVGLSTNYGRADGLDPRAATGPAAHIGHPATSAGDPVLHTGAAGRRPEAPPRDTHTEGRVPPHDIEPGIVAALQAQPRRGGDPTTLDPHGGDSSAHQNVSADPRKAPSRNSGSDRGGAGQPQGPAEWLNAVHGCLIGGAIGDALGAPIETMSLRKIRDEYGYLGVTDEADQLRISEETQLTAFTVEALIRGSVRARAKGIGGATLGLLQQGMLVWLRGQVGELPEQPTALHSSLAGHRELVEQRGVANSVYTSLRAVAERREPTNPLGTRDRPINNSKGSGALMRSAPCGFGYAADRSGAALTAIFELGCDTAALTHGHPSGWLPAGVLAALVYQMSRGIGTKTAVERALAELATYPHHEETTAALDAAITLAARTARPARVPRPEDLETLGEGWIGPEALAIAVYAMLAAETVGGPGHVIVRTGLLLSVNHSGDSDATGSIAGSLLGARYGRGALPHRWSRTVDARPVLERLATDYCTEFGLTPPRDEHGRPTRDWSTTYPA
ncbi:ADP-ribosylglycohydrolase family protein [Nocardia coubleae]|uniref:non-specific serine/threonine protein kinase n=1 Tax=Nocardia coubleae TaxID=356147 RepID=A0A846W712_9NOCA|nr:ADP-ribosylglycohydrolase family protein [Nocardia coubleae]NKX88397.1 protein kinase [Nocardia coubleae]